jgi:2Fe-2S ferredoxin
MPRITIENLASKAIECEDNSEKLLHVLLNHTDWMHACGGKGNCTTCKAIVLKGNEHLGPLSEAEIKFMNLNKLHANERLCCQVNVSGDIVIKVAEAYKLPHLKYSN